MVVPAGGGVATNFVSLSGAIMDVVTDSSGNVYAINADPTNGIITKITPAGTAEEFATGFSGPRGIVFDHNGNMFVANLNGGTVIKITGIN